MILEGSEALGESLLAPLRLMTQHQAKYNPAVAGRCRWAVQPAEDDKKDGQDEATAGMNSEELRSH